MRAKCDQQALLHTLMIPPFNILACEKLHNIPLKDNREMERNGWNSPRESHHNPVVHVHEFKAFPQHFWSQIYQVQVEKPALRTLWHSFPHGPFWHKHILQTMAHFMFSLWAKTAKSHTFKMMINIKHTKKEVSIKSHAVKYIANHTYEMFSVCFLCIAVYITNYGLCLNMFNGESDFS